MIFINGIQRSGTNFACKIHKNSSDYSFPYWKHDPKLEGIDPDCTKVFCIIKNPYTWVESICFRNPVDIVKWFPSQHLKDHKDHLGPHQINLKRLCITYKLFYASWLNYNKTKLIHYEQLLKTYRNIADVPYTDWNPDRIDQYLNYKTTLPHAAINIITETLGEDFFNRIGYPTK